MSETSELEANITKLRTSLCKLVTIKFRKEITETLNNLSRCEGETTVPEISQSSVHAEEFSDDDYDRLKRRLKRTEKLVDLLEYKRKCPISQVVDWI